MAHATRGELVAEAERILENQVCECGHLEGDHLFTMRARDGITGMVSHCRDRCPCKFFQPVRFKVELVE